MCHYHLQVSPGHTPVSTDNTNEVVQLDNRYGNVHCSAALHRHYTNVMAVIVCTRDFQQNTYHLTIMSHELCTKENVQYKKNKLFASLGKL